MDKAQHTDMAGMARHVRAIIRIAGGALVLLFGWLKLNNEEVGRALSGSSPQLLLHVSLALYYLSWVAGTTNDTNEQERAYAYLPAGATFPRGGYFAVASLVAVFGLLCWVDSPRAFSTLLAIFLVANVASWRYMVAHVLRGPISTSAERLAAENDYLAIAILDSFRNYIAGPWQWKRFIAGGVMVACMLGVAYFGVPQPLSRRALFMDADRVIGIMLVLYVVGFEAWIWLMRCRVTVTRHALSGLGRRYALVPRLGSAGRPAERSLKW